MIAAKLNFENVERGVMSGEVTKYGLILRNSERANMFKAFTLSAESIYPSVAT